MPKTAAATPRRRTRLSPDDRRDQILEGAMRLFGERGYSDVSAGDIARAAGVTPALVHHYFGPKREIWLAVVHRFGTAVAEIERPPSDVPLADRLRGSLGAWMDWVEENRGLWLATAGLGDVIPDPDILAIVTASREQTAQRILDENADLVDDTPEARFALLCWMGLNQAALRRWLRGDATRELTHALLTQSLVAVLRDVIPALPKAS